MTVFAGTLALVFTVLFVVFLAAAVIAKAAQEGSLQADARWVRGYIRLAIKRYTPTR